jgi:alpha-ketoglutarate-dependent taurine dioxygenase
VAVAFRWEPGDVVVVDNLAVAHARCPYRGARRHHVMLGRDPLEARR